MDKILKIDKVYSDDENYYLEVTNSNLFSESEINELTNKELTINEIGNNIYREENNVKR